MIKISGFVVLQNKNAAVSNKGIPRLVVAVYDPEKPLTELIKDHKVENGFAAGLMQHLENRIIRSVLTDEHGKFQFEDLKIEGNKEKPDLIIIVFAPEDVIDINNPVPKSPEKRILYLSTGPRIKVGAEHAYSIRLLQKQIDEFNIPIPNEEDSKKTVSTNQYFKNIDDTHVLKETFKERFGPKIKEQQEKHSKSRKTIEEKTKNLSALPIALRQHPFLLKDPNDLEEFQKKAVKEGLENFKNYENTIRLNLTNDDLKSLKIRKDGEERSKIKIDTTSLSKKINALTGGIDLLRKKDLLPSEISPESLYKKYFPKVQEDKLNNNINPE
jgi:hypothetical protein